MFRGSFFYHPRIFNGWLLFFMYWLAAVFSTEIEVLFGRNGQDGVRVLSIVFFLIIILCLLTIKPQTKMWLRIVFIPMAFIGHVFFTIPASSALGILRYQQGITRTIGEQRAVFLLASIPVILTAMKYSRLFSRATEK